MLERVRDAAVVAESVIEFRLLLESAAYSRSSIDFVVDSAKLTAADASDAKFTLVASKQRLQLARPGELTHSVEAYRKTARFLNFICGVTDSYFGSWLVLILAAVDPSLSILTFLQTVKITSKLKYLNLNFGGRLLAFVDNLKDVSSFVQAGEQSADVYNSVGHRGKLSDRYVELQFYKIMPDRLATYLVSCLLMAWRHIAKMQVSRLPKPVLQFLIVYPRIHFALFYLVFADLLLFAARCLLHGRDLPLNVFAACVAFALASLDFYLLFDAADSDRDWRRASRYHVARGKRIIVNDSDKEAGKRLQVDQASTSRSRLE